ncbi:MAG: MoaF N-terminal domain-containing protein, partial [Microbacterium sp.]|nr:MoaF N-terminal domain-containing protein [Microbacterium sp.]
MTEQTTDPAQDEWRTYDDFAAGIDTYRLPNISLAGDRIALALEGGGTLSLAFNEDAVSWSASGAVDETGATDPYDAVSVRADVVFVHLPLTS